MQIVQRNNRFYLQFDTGELELSEKQLKKRIERGDVIQHFSNKKNKPLPEVNENIVIDAIDKPEKDYKQISVSHHDYSSAKYFEHILVEFEQIYAANEDKKATLQKLKSYCNNALKKLNDDRKNAKTDHVVIDYYLIAWNRVLHHIDQIPEIVAQKEATGKTENNLAGNGTLVEIRPFDNSNKKTDYTKELLVIQLLQADGQFPINNAIEGVTQQDIQKLIAILFNLEEQKIKEYLLSASEILLKRNIHRDNIEYRINLLKEVEDKFQELPYPNIISRLKLLISIYTEKAASFL